MVSPTASDAQLLAQMGILKGVMSGLAVFLGLAVIAIVFPVIAHARTRDPWRATLGATLAAWIAFAGIMVYAELTGDMADGFLAEMAIMSVVYAWVVLALSFIIGAIVLAVRKPEGS